jgi:hypothetical protein
MFFKRKEVWVPTWKAWLLFVAVCGLVAIALLRFTAPFLAPVKPVNARVLLIEGWISDSGLEHALRLNASNRYDLVITAGLGIQKGMDISHYGNYAELAASRLTNMGFTGTNLVKVPGPDVRKDRTYHTALLVRGFLLTNTTYRSIDILSDGVHARRTWLLYGIACRPEIKVGIIANDVPDFDARNWWKSSNGVRIVLNEAIGYLYAKLAFNPD